MRITVRADAELQPDLTHLARRRVEFAMRRFDTRVRAVTAHLTHVDGSRGNDNRCLIRVHLGTPTLRPIVIEDTDADAAMAIERAVDRAARSVARALHALSDWRSVRSQL